MHQDVNKLQRFFVIHIFSSDFKFPISGVNRTVRFTIVYDKRLFKYFL